MLDHALPRIQQCAGRGLGEGGACWVQDKTFDLTSVFAYDRPCFLRQRELPLLHVHRGASRGGVLEPVLLYEVAERDELLRHLTHRGVNLTAAHTGHLLAP